MQTHRLLYISAASLLVSSMFAGLCLLHPSNPVHFIQGSRFHEVPILGVASRSLFTNDAIASKVPVPASPQPHQPLGSDTPDAQIPSKMNTPSVSSAPQSHISPNPEIDGESPTPHPPKGTSTEDGLQMLPLECLPYMKYRLPKDRFVGGCLIRKFPDLDIPHSFTGRIDQEQVHRENVAANTENQDYTGDMKEVLAFESQLTDLWERQYSSSASESEEESGTFTDPYVRGHQTVLPMTLVVPVRIAEVKGCVSDMASFLFQLPSVPDEIIVVVSHVEGSMRQEGALQKTLDIIADITLCVPGIEFVIRQAHHDAGSNRNIGAYLAKHSIITAFDVDDVPHPNRFQYIHMAFTVHQDLDYLLTEFEDMYNWTTPMPAPDNPPVTDIDTILKWEYRTVQEVYRVAVKRLARRTGQAAKFPWCGEIKLLGPAHNGWMTIRRSAWEKHPFVRAYRGQDLKMFGQMVTQGFNVNAIGMSLGYYRRRPKKCGLHAAATCPFAQ